MKKLPFNNLILSVVVEKDKDGYTAECRELQGCYTEGRNYEEVMKNIREAVQLHLEDRVSHDDFYTADFENNNVSLTTLSFPIPKNVS
jgi:predicted RNase H-like HicB family nuclease